jgi:hypothetical protein
MPKRIKQLTKDEVINTALPQHASTYTVIPHSFVITETENQLKQAGFEVERETYRGNDNNQVVSCTMHLKAGDDSDMKMMFAWANSYDKSMRFKCAIGGYLPQSQSVIVSGNMGTWGRKHTGTADTETKDTIAEQISKASSYYDNLVRDKESMKSVILTKTAKAQLAGVLYIEHGLLTGEQLGILKEQIRKPAHNYSGDKDSLWVFYCNIIYTLQRSHPRSWLDQQRIIHWFLTDSYQIFNEPKDNNINLADPGISETINPNQITIDQVIAEENNKESAIDHSL